MLEMVKTLNSAEFPTHFSCQADERWAIPRRRVRFSHADAHRLLNLCLALQASTLDGFELKMTIDNYYEPKPVRPFADLAYIPEREAPLIRAIKQFTECDASRQMKRYQHDDWMIRFHFPRILFALSAIRR